MAEEMRETRSEFMATMESIPSQVYWGMAIGSVMLSAFFFLTGRKQMGLFVGQWPPTFLALAMFYKLIRPSREQPEQEMRGAMREMRETMR